MRRVRHILQSVAHLLGALAITVGLLAAPGLAVTVADAAPPARPLAYLADGPFTAVLNINCNGSFNSCGYGNFTGLGQIDAVAITNIAASTGQGFGAYGGIYGNFAPNPYAFDGTSTIGAAPGAQHICWYRPFQAGVCDNFFGAGLWNTNGVGNPSTWANSTGALSANFLTGRLAAGAVVTFYILYGSVSATPTPTAGPTNTPSETPTPTITPTPGPTDTPTLSPTPGPSPTFGGPLSLGGNLIRNWDFNTAPHLPSSEWSVLNQVVQAPVSLADPVNVAHLSKGSCGPQYWDMGTPAFGANQPGSVFQDFQWPGGSMFINFEAVTDSYFTFGNVKVTNKDTGSEYTFLPFTNGTNTWQSFKLLAPGQAPGRYSLSFSLQGLNRPNALVIDNVNLRTGYWGNDCPPGQYDGSIPTNGTIHGTATAVATATYVPGAAGANVIQNCDYESGAANWTLANPGVSLQQAGGATGPTWAHLFNLTLPSFPVPQIFAGDIYQSFNWPGGPMYTSFFLQDSSKVIMRIKNVQTGFKLQVFTSAQSNTATGWTRYNAVYQPDGPGQYIIEFEVPAGSASAGVDGVAVAPNEYATGGCANANTNDGNATQVVINQTATAATSPTAGAATGTANAVATDDANAYATYVHTFYGTATAISAVIQTEVQQETQTQAAQWTATESARDTATAQGTAVASATATPPAPPTLTPTFPPPATLVIPPATQTAIVGNVNATITAIWGSVQTQEAAASQTQGAAFQETARAAATQTAQMAGQLTQQAVVNATAYAQQTATAAWATQAQATYSAGATQTALVIGGNATAIARATQTQAANQTQTQIAAVTANYLGTQRAAATQTALVATGDAGQVASATHEAAMTQTAVAAATTEAVVTTSYNATVNAHATGTAQAGATQTALVATANATNIAAATLTAIATVNQIATEMAQATITAQAQGTQVAQGTQAVEPRPEPAPYVDCVRPTNPLWLADWIDYEFCRLMTWFVWSPTNSQQVTALQTNLGQYEPLGTLLEISNARSEVQDQLYQYDWARTGLQQDDTLLPLITVFFPNHVPNGILTGNLVLTPNPISPLAFDTVCTLKVGDIFGQAVAQGLCASINWLIAIGIMGWVQYLFDLVTWVAFIRYAWYTVTQAIPSML